MIRTEKEFTTEVREKMRDGKGCVEIRHFFQKQDFGAKVRLCARLILKPGCGIGRHQHENEDEFYLVLAGTAVLDDGNTSKTLNTGDAVLTRHGESHSIMNTGSETLEILAFIVQYR